MSKKRFMNVSDYANKKNRTALTSNNTGIF